jgi:hypothetical protein
MNPILRNILGVIAGILVGGTVNGALISLSPHIIAPPAGYDLTTEEGLRAGMAMMQPKHFLMPFLAHALGTFVGAFIAAKIAATSKMIIAIAIGIVFMIGGIMMVMMLPSPLWFDATDLVLAYIPMAYLGAKLAR